MFKKNEFIVGSGFIAKKFKKYSYFFRKNDVIIYAAGISNSQERNKKSLKREILLANQFCAKNIKRVVYISTCSINDFSRNKSKYVKNKIIIENIIRKKTNDYIIVRLPEVVGYSNNPNTLTNFFFNKIFKSKSFALYKNTKRNIIDVEDAVKYCIKIIKSNKYRNKTVSLLNKQFYTPLNIVELFEKIFNKKAHFQIKVIAKKKWISKNNYYIKSNKNYLLKVLKKYYT